MLSAPREKNKRLTFSRLAMILSGLCDLMASGAIRVGRIGIRCVDVAEGELKRWLSLAPGVPGVPLFPPRVPRPSSISVTRLGEQSWPDAYLSCREESTSMRLAGQSPEGMHFVVKQMAIHGLDLGLVLEVVMRIL